MAVEGGSGSAADSYIGSLICLTSKSEMRYEGVLYNINTEESSIGLQNVRSFGTEGRKKDGPQIPPSEKVYEYILFRGSDIKDLQVKSSPAAQNSSPVNNDPAIIQSQNPHAALASTNLHSVVVSTTADTSLQTSQLGMPESNVQNGASLYQPGRSVGSWGPSPPSANGSGIGMPMYWQGYYAPPNGLPSHQYQQPSMRPPGLSMPSLLHQQMPPQMPPSLQQHMPSSLQQKIPSSIQQHMPSSIQQQIPSSLQQPMPSSLQWQSLPQLMPSSLQQQMPSLFQQPLQYPNFSAPLPNGSSSLPAAPSLFPSGTSTGITTSTSISSSSTTFPSCFLPTLTVLPVTSLALDAVSSLIPIKAPIAAIKTPVTSLSPASLLLSSGLDGNALLQPLSSRPITTTSPVPDQNENVPHSVPSNVAAANPMAISTQAPAPALLTPGHLLKSSSISLVPSSQKVHKDVEVVRVSSSSVPEPSASVDLKVQPPTQPLSPPSMPIYKPNAARTQSYHGYKGRGRGRGRMNSSLLTTFSEDFDFTAMNEKFNKDEVWGHLGKSSKSLGQEDEKHGDEEFSQYEEFGLPKIDIKPVYNKDDFFDSLSSNTRDHESNRGRHWFSEQRKIDTETFGEFSRYRGSRGRHGPGRGGGGRYRGSYYGRDFGRGGYGYERIRGCGGPN